MPPLYTQNLGIEKPANGEEDGSWGGIVNENMDIIDRAINGVLSLTLSGTSSTLTTSSGTLNNGQYKLLALTGTPSGTHTITIAPNTAQKIYFVANATGQSVVFTQGSGGNVTIAAGDSAIIYAYGTGAGSGVSNIADFLAMSSPNITGGTITGATITAAGDLTIPDKIVHAGDTNTSIRFPADDTVTVETVGVERLRITGDTVNMPGATTETKTFYVGAGRTSNGSSSLKLIGDATYTDYGSSLIRANGGANATTSIIHRGTGALQLVAIEAGDIILSTSSLARMYIRGSNGNVGIGTGATPASKLEVAGTISATDGSLGAPAYTFGDDLTTGMYRLSDGRLSFATSGFESMQLNGTTRNFPVPTGDGAILLGNGRTGDGNVHYNLIGDTTYTSYGMRLQRAAGANGSTSLNHRGTGNLSLVAQEAAPIVFYTNNSEAARIDSVGRLLVGRTSYGGADNVVGTQVTDTGVIFTTSTTNHVINRITADGSIFQFRRQNVAVGAITVSASATAYATSSDYRLKENVAPVANAADRVLLLKPRNFNFISDPANPVDGFLAHEAQAVVPNAVVGVKDEVDAEGAPVHQSIDHSKLVPLLTAALQEALAKITALEARVTALEA